MSDVNATVAAAVASSLGRLPFREPRQARTAELALLEIARGEVAASSRPAASASRGQVPVAVAHGLYSLARGRRTLGDLTPESITWLRAAVLEGERQGSGASPQGRASGRRLAWLALIAAGHRDDPGVLAAMTDPDPQVRRLAVAFLPNVSDSSLQRRGLAAARRDTSHLVRLEWIRVYRQLLASGDCSPLIEAIEDLNAHVHLAAIDGLGGQCPDSTNVARTLMRFITPDSLQNTGPRHPSVTWQSRAHALVALARVAPAHAMPFVRLHASHETWQVRMYAARAAATVRDTMSLNRLAFDSIGSVREVAIEGLASVAGHVADLVFVRALQSHDYHVVLAAARALRGAPVRDSVVPAIVSALARLTAEKRETSRDLRMELMARLDELGDGRTSSMLIPYTRDFDPAVAARAVVALRRLSPEANHFAAPQLLPVDRSSLDTLDIGKEIRLRVTMSQRGSFVVRLFPDVAPATVDRILALVARGWYDGLTWHRVAPNFVIQGGSPAMNEYVGDGPFMRDELSSLHHLRGTLGISTRGRDTGDAQWFINLVDNYRLDFDYTVFGVVEGGMQSVDSVLEGDVIQKVEVIR
jgi:cyclophilin family peptidyl-prolyl cis-trans isomerase/HEAT repeat protein